MATREHYNEFEKAYTWFNSDLFGNDLPPCLVTMARKANSRGYFSGQRWTKNGTEDLTDEIALHPETFKRQPVIVTLSTLVHEMVHCWEAHFAPAHRAGYHTRTWANKMIEVGLVPSDTGQPGGKQTGQHMTHYIVQGGRYEKSAQAILDLGWTIPYLDTAELASIPPNPGPGAGPLTPAPIAKPSRSRAITKVKYSCLTCKVNAWGKPSLFLICGNCQAAMFETL